MPRVRIEYRTKIFGDIWKDYDAFKADYDVLYPLINGAVNNLSAGAIQATYYLMYSKYGNTPIISTDEYQWKLKVMKIISTYGPTWEKKKSIQATLRTLTESEITQGSKQIYNHAFNPSTEPSTSDIEELTHINDQNTTNNIKAKMEAYSILWANLHVDSTDEYLGKFKECFCRFVGNQFPIIYVTDESEEEDEGE